MLRIKDPDRQWVIGPDRPVHLVEVLQEIVGIDVLQEWEMNQFHRSFPDSESDESVGGESSCEAGRY